VASRGKDFESEWGQIEDHLRVLMSHSSRVNEQDRLFRYPLAVATYGVEEVLGALESMTSFRTTMWSKTQDFENSFADRFGAQEAVMVNSGSSADLLMAFALRDPRFGGLEVGDEVLAPAVTWPTQIWSLLMAGFTVKLVDVDPETLNISLDDLERKIGPRTRAISMVHLMGNTADLDRVVQIAAKHSLVVLEDACEALGASWRGKPVGSFGQAGSFSFFFSHHMVTMEGGMIATNSGEYAEHLRLLRAHGWTRNLRHPPEAQGGLDSRYQFDNWGFNVRPTELNAAFGLVQLERVEGFQAKREKAAAYAIARIGSLAEWLSPMRVSKETLCSWFAFPVLVNSEAPFTRSELVSHLESQGIETRPVVAGNLGRQPAVHRLEGISVGDLPGADYVHEHGFYLGIHPVSEMESEFERVWDVIEGFVKSK
jgi:CDP-6-deoxy-D-xylo-4-hexulose-3-dehydrase